MFEGEELRGATGMSGAAHVVRGVGEEVLMVRGKCGTYSPLNDLSLKLLGCRDACMFPLSMNCHAIVQYNLFVPVTKCTAEIDRYREKYGTERFYCTQGYSSDAHLQQRLRLSLIHI